MQKVLEATNKEETFLIASELINGDFRYDSLSSHNAGYPIYRTIDRLEWISDLGCRLEVNTVFGYSCNIWIIDRADQIRKQLVTLAKEFGYTSKKGWY